MKDDYNSIVTEALNLGATRAGVVDVSAIRFSGDFRKLCEQNKCGQYGKNWMCPPAIAPFEEIMAKTASFKKCLVFQTVHKLSSSLDWKGMKKAAVFQNEVLGKIVKHMKELFGDVFPMGAGPCMTCEKCSYLRNEPCRFPEKAVASLESCGVDVSELASACGMPYHSGKGTVTYAGVVFF